MHPIGTVLTVKMHHVGTVPTDKMHPVGTVPVGTLIFMSLKFGLYSKNRLWLVASVFKIEPSKSHFPTPSHS